MGDRFRRSREYVRWRWLISESGPFKKLVTLQKYYWPAQRVPTASYTILEDDSETQGVVDNNSGVYQSLIDPHRKWYNNRRLIALHGWLFLLLITSSMNGFDASLMNGLQSEVSWNEYFNHPRGGRLGLINAILNIGSVVACPFAPYLSDGIGRRKTVAFGAVIMLAATAVQTAARSVGVFIAARFLVGFGLAIASNSAPMLVAEVSYPPYRGPVTSMYNCLWYSGSIIAAWTTFGAEHFNNTTWSWRLPSLLQGLPALAQVLLIWFVPESPRWLVSEGRDSEAIEILAYYHADSNKKDPLIVYEYDEIKTSIELDRVSKANVGWKSLFSTPGNRKRLRIIIALAWFSQWSGNGLVSFYLTKVLNNIGITKPSIQLLINGILQTWNLFWALLASSLVDKAGRRVLFLTSSSGMFVCFTLQTVLTARYLSTHDSGLAHAVIAFIFLFYAFYDLAFSPLIVSYALEILPYPIRAKGFTLFHSMVSAAVIFNQYVNPIAMEHIAWKYYILYCVILVFEVFFLYFFLEETKGLSLEETAVIFDGEDGAAKKIKEHAIEQVGLTPLGED
ncbi:general substrate transporter [Multifurca ochricompacta]|uniref:General substrate transporter n=1 Tax=Multifurca ochricompacta TaxID=376703 RepID=A0AAD4M1S5_9AGAM|nr:general substrate transporter [Multifurca ochricompacta]